MLIPWFQLLFSAPSDLVWNLTSNRQELRYNISNTFTQLFFHLKMWTTPFLLGERTVNYQLSGDLITPHATVIDWQFSCLSWFSSKGYKSYRDQGRVTFLAPLRHILPCQITLLFATLPTCTLWSLGKQWVLNCFLLNLDVCQRKYWDSLEN